MHGVSDDGADGDLGRLLLVLRLFGRQGIDDLPRRRAGFERFMARLPEAPPHVARARGLADVPTEEVAPPGIGEGAPVVLYLHGGGYCLGGAATHRALAARLAHAAGARVFVPEYRRAPEHRFPAAFDDALAACRAAAAEVGVASLALGGDSAGGGLAIAVASALVAAGEARPAALFALSPWVDLGNESASIDARAARDLLVDRAGLEAMARLYLDGADARDPRASPLRAALAGLPPTLVQVGEDECLRDDAARLASALLAADVPVELEVWPRTVHVWHLYAGIAGAGERAIARVGAFLRERLTPRVAALREGGC